MGAIAYEAVLLKELDDIDSLLCRAQSRAGVSNNLVTGRWADLQVDAKSVP